MILLEETRSHASDEEAAAPQENQVSSRAAVVIAPDETRVLFYTGPDRVLDMLASVPGAWHIPEKRTLGFPLTREAMLCVEMLGRLEEANDLYHTERSRLLRPSDRALSAYPPTPASAPSPLQHQIEAFGYALDTFARGIHGFGQFSEQGLGKTKWGVDLMRHLMRRGCAVVIGQKITLYQWEEELARNWPEAKTVMLRQDGKKERTIPQQLEYLSAFRKNGPMARPKQPHVFLINWEALARLVRGFLAMNRLIVGIADESARAKNRNTQRARALLKLRENVEYRVAMTGTPMGNEPGDFFTQYSWIDPTIFGYSYWNFARYYFRLGGFSGNDFVGLQPDRIVPFITRLYSCAYRTTKALVTDMPPKSFMPPVKLKMTPEQTKLYDQITEAMYAEMENEDGTRGALAVPSALARITRLQQITAGIFPITELLAGEDEDFEREGKTYRLIPSAKTIWLREFVRETLEADAETKIVVWTRFRPELKAIVDGLKEDGWIADHDFSFIHGGTPDRKREELRQAYNDRSNPLRVLVCQIQAASHGLDLPAADILVYHSNTYSFINRAQSEDRGHRVGRVRPYLIYDLICQGTVDVEIVRALRQKKSLSDFLMTKGFTERMLKPGLDNTAET